MNMRWMAVLLAGMLCLTALSGCKAPVEEVAVESEPDTTSELEIVQQVEEKAESTINPLTGEEVTAQEAVVRPQSFIINNAEKAWPQCGISEADIVYEWPYEGSATRLMAVFTDCTAAETVGPLRSVRHDFVEMSMPLNTIFVHWGGSKPGYAALKSYDIENVDGMTGYSCFFRDQDRLNAGTALEHTAMVDTAKLVEQIAKLGYATETEIEPAYQFNTEEEPIVFEDVLATDVTIQISGETTCNLQYDAEIEKYTKYEYGRQQVDANNDQPVELDNVFILYGRISSYDGEHVWRDLKLEEGGTGYYLTRGTKTPITWEKKDQNAGFVYKKETGEELVVNPGNSWVIIAETGAETTWGAASSGED